MFGVIVSGRLVQTDGQQIGENQVLFNIQEADNINHVVVFMTGQTPFPDGLGGAVYFSWPSAVGQTWQLLGHITNEKPSAIFRITKLKTDAAGAGDPSHPFGSMTFETHLAQIGISVEPLTQLAQQTPDTFANTSNVEPFLEFGRKMLESFFNFASSYTITQAQMTPNPNETYVPISPLQNWFTNFQRRFEQNPYFWRS